MNQELLAPAVLFTEAGLCLLFCGLLICFRKQLSGTDMLVWSLVWLCRVLASLSGSFRLQVVPTAQAWYLGLQTCSAIALIVMLARTHASVLKERWGKRVVLGLASIDMRPAPSPSNVAPN
jgi:lysylphosphatidylglycerol synthetase-like protein (DUF2156 family)